MSLPLSLIRDRFIGLDTEYPLASGGVARRRYLDSAASSLMLRPAWETAEAFLKHYANTHSLLHHGARVATHACIWAHERALALVGADPATYACAFAGSGSTGCFNRIARSLAALRPERDVVLVSGMEHHSNDLPHRKHAGQVEHIPMTGVAPAFGALDLKVLAARLESNRGRVNYVAITGASNVTGIINPLKAIAELVHAHDAWLVVDGSQLVMHAPVHMSDGIDFFAFSGHKVYAPGSPGVIVGRRDLLIGLEPDEVGGGMVDDVSLEDYIVSESFPGREEAGTPNIVGAVLLGAALETLMQIGMDKVHEAEQAMLAPLLRELASRPRVRVYGDTDLARSPRTGTVAFNLEGLDHGLVAAALNDYFGVAVRNACFCAHPYVREMLKPELWDSTLDVELESGIAELEMHQGMVRASFGLYTTWDDVQALLAGIDRLCADAQGFRDRYERGSDGVPRHRGFSAPVETLFDPGRELARAIAGGRPESPARLKVGI
ncbi:MAG: aminotransferase class V-fold PLP-dependent enzyme [Betaproteobacteria bacterium]|nr:aminotransferase class V-fold PLP-dependent enzyme [Betaproteobacteria bacterium]